MIASCPKPAYAILATTLAVAGAAHTTLAASAFRGTVEAVVERVVDGDTIEVHALIWLEQSVDVRVRIDGVDAPELKSRCQEERRQALAARDYLARRLGGASIRLSSIVHDKYGGRVRARVSDGAGDVGDALIARGLARPYHGARRLGWCPAA